MQNYKLDKIFHINIRTCHQLGVKRLGPKDLPSRDSRTLFSILQTSIYSFYPESRGKSNEQLKYIRINLCLGAWVLTTRFGPTGPKRLKKSQV